MGNVNAQESKIQSVIISIFIEGAYHSKYTVEVVKPDYSIESKEYTSKENNTHVILKQELDKWLEQGNRILLPIKTDHAGDNYIEIIPHKAKAGYLNSYSDPEFIDRMQHITLPFLTNGKYRAFPVDGDSMPPHQDGSFIIAKFIEDHREVKIGKTYVLLTLNEGIVYKRIAGKEKKSVLLSSDNAFYEPYQVKFSEILEIWEYASSIATKEFEPDDLNAESIKSMFVQLKRDIAEIKEWK